MAAPLTSPDLPKPSTVPLPDLPTVYISNDRGYVWDADTALTLRTRYHVLGALVGTLPRMPLQNTFFGLPLLLMDEEVTVLLRNGLIKLAASPGGHGIPKKEDIQALARKREEAMNTYLEERRRVADIMRKSKRAAARTKAGTKPGKKKKEEIGMSTSTDPSEPESIGSRGERKKSVTFSAKVDSVIPAAHPDTTQPKNPPSQPPPLRVPSRLNTSSVSEETASELLTPMTELSLKLKSMALKSPVMHGDDDDEDEQSPSATRAITPMTELSTLMNMMGLRSERGSIVPEENAAEGESLSSLFAPDAELPGAQSPSHTPPRGVDATASIETAVDPALPLPLNPPLPITIPTSSQFLPWFSVKSSQSSTLDRELWTYPRTPQEERHCKVFCALWEKGFFITSGSKFGGDYLLYPGDILRFHAHFIVAVVPMKTLYSPLDAVMFGRLGTAVKKRFALCSWDDEKDELVSFSLEWTGWN